MNANQLANASSKNNTLFLFLGVMVIAFLLVPDQAHAGTGGTAFDDVWVTLKDWTQGTLGRIVAGAMILVGVVGGIARQSLMAFAMGIGGGMGLYNSPVMLPMIRSCDKLPAFYYGVRDG
nr:hypothetical protein TCT1_36980 [Xenorhabdus sp. TCT-1]